MTDDLFGKKDIGALFGYIQVFFTIAGLLGVIVSGFIYDMTQSYQMAMDLLSWFIYRQYDEYPSC